MEKRLPVLHLWNAWLSSSQSPDTLYSPAPPKAPTVLRAGPLASNKACGRVGHPSQDSHESRAEVRSWRILGDSSVPWRNATRQLQGSTRRVASSPGILGSWLKTDMPGRGGGELIILAHTVRGLSPRSLGSIASRPVCVEEEHHSWGETGGGAE